MLWLVDTQVCNNTVTQQWSPSAERPLRARHRVLKELQVLTRDSHNYLYEAGMIDPILQTVVVNVCFHLVFWLPT